MESQENESQLGSGQQDEDTRYDDSKEGAPRKGCLGRYWKKTLAAYLCSYVCLSLCGGYVEVSDYFNTGAVHHAALCWTLHEGHFHGTEIWLPSMIGLVYFPLIMADGILIHRSHMAYCSKEDGHRYYFVVNGKLIKADENEPMPNESDSAK